MDIEERGQKRKAYTVDFKKAIVEQAQGKNLKAFCVERNLDLRMVGKWRHDYDQICLLASSGNGRKRKCGSGRRAEHPQLEDAVYDYIADRRALKLVVRRSQIQNIALEMALQSGISSGFMASSRWLDNFLQRYNLSLRRSTTLFKLEDNEIVKRALAFKSYLDSADLSKYAPSNIIAMDETAVFLGQHSNTTINQRGASSIYVPSTGYESARVSCVLAIRADGTKVTPMIISKGKTRNSIQRISGVDIIESEKAWATQDVIRKWIDSTFPVILRGKQRGLLVWDSASTHRAKEMKTFLAARRIDQIMIPAGMTAYLQALDIAVNKPFKDRIRQEVNEYIENRMEKNHRGNFVKPNLQEVARWVRNAWDAITDDCVAGALKAGYLIHNRPFQESYIAKHDRLGPLIQVAMGPNQLTDDNSVIYDDIPEEDEMALLDDDIQ